MAIITSTTTVLWILFLSFHFSFYSFSTASSPRKLVLLQNPQLLLNYHNGPLLKGNYTLNLLYYGNFSPSQRAIISDFIRSLSSPPHSSSSSSVSSWWATTSKYNSGPTHLHLGDQFLDDSYSLGKSIKSTAFSTLLSGKLNPGPNTITVLLTSADVAVDGFCSSRCGTHGSLSPESGPYAWVGNPSSQCPGQCAWPFHQPIYGPQNPPLVSPNGDVGVDGMIINLATVLAGTVTNPFGNGFYQGPGSAGPEAVSACTGKFGPGSYPGYPGQVQVDPASGASYNALGFDGRKYLLPAMWDPTTSQCATLA